MTLSVTRLHRQLRRAAQRQAAAALRLLAATAIALLPALAPPAIMLLPVSARAQHTGDVGIAYTQERSKFAGAYCQCFPLRGASVDGAYDIYRGLGVVGVAQGVAVSNLRGSIDIHQVSFMGGVRYSRSLGDNSPFLWGRRGSIFAEALGGYTLATAGLYPNSNNTALTDHASALTYMAGGGINVKVYHRLDVRLVEADYVISQLPNGGNNQQRTLRMAAGLNVHIGR